MPRSSRREASESPLPRRLDSPRRKSASEQDKSPTSRHRRSFQRSSRSPPNKFHKPRSPEREKRSSRTKSPKQSEADRALLRSPSLHTKRVRNERAAEKVVARKRERHGNGESREASREVAESRLDRDDVDGREDSYGRRRKSASPKDRRHGDKLASGSPRGNLKLKERDEVKMSRVADQHHEDDDSVAKMKAAEEALEAKQKQQPSFELSGKLADETNRVRGVTLLFTEPPEARKPDIRWRLYVFKGGEELNDPLYIHRQSCYLFGRERRVADVPTDHPSCSKQHAVIQFRQVEKEQPDGMLKKEVRPYLMDLGSTNGTFINESRIEPQRYYE